MYVAVLLPSIVLLFGPAGRAADLDARRLQGKAFYENDDFMASAEQFRQAIALAPGSAPDCFNLSLALMRAADYTNALAALARAEQLDPKLLNVHYLRGIIFKRQGEFARAVESLRRVVTADPACLGAYYNLAICYKSAEQHTNAIATLKAALEHEPRNPNCHYQLITLYRRIGDVEGAARHAEAFEQVKDTVDEAEKTVEALERSQYTYVIEVPPARRDPGPHAGPPVRFADVTKEAGLALRVKPPPLPPPSPPSLERAAFNPAEWLTRYAVWTSGSVALGDYDGDGRLDIYVVQGSTNAEASANRLYHNDGSGHFTDVTDQAGVGDRGLGMHAVWGDFDNDRRLDLYVVNAGPNVLYRNRGDSTFEDVSVKARANEPLFGSRAAWVDYDHDHDLDLYVANTVDFTDPPKRESFAVPDDLAGQVNTLLRNNGQGTFSDLTDEAGLLVDAAQTRDLVFADFDGDHDTDLFVANSDAPSRLFLNARLGRFTQGGAFSPPLAKGATAAAEGDCNRDGQPDLLVAVATNLLLYTNDGRASFKAASLSVLFPLTPPLSPRERENRRQPARPSEASGKTAAPNATLPLPKGEGRGEGEGTDQTQTGGGSPGAGSVSRLRILDFNNDGWPDVLLTDGSRLHLLAGIARCQFRDVTAATGLDAIIGHIADFAAGDLDGDGDLDLVVQTRDRGPLLLRNDGGHGGHWLAVRLAGKKVNRLGYGATIEVAASGHYQKQTVRDAVVHFGLGHLTRVEVVRVTWPNGMAQNVIQPAVDRVLDLEEYVKVSASCAFLWADAGRGFQLVNEILGIGPLGVPRSAKALFPVDCTELTRIEADQLAAKDGHYELRLTEDLRELAYVDQVELRVVDHPAGLEIIPNEMFTGPPFPEDKFFAVPEHRLPRSAVDDRGHAVLDLIGSRDGRCPTFPLTPHDGLAQPHHLTLDLGDLADAKQILLGLDGWIYWADSSVSWGVFQNPSLEITPLKLEVRDAQGRWHTAIESVGLPTSKGLVVPVDLTGKFPTRDWHVRLSTTMRVYFDRIFVSTRDEAARCRTTLLPAAHADLHFRGFHRMTRDELGYERFDYAKVSPTGPWNPPRGLLTRYGDVTPLLARPDDMYVILAPGDEMLMRFDARKLPALPAGWKRSFIFYANGWVKDGDLNTRCSETVEPLPFHAMSAYPYPATERYPDDPAHRAYLRQYQTRPSRQTTGDLTQFTK